MGNYTNFGGFENPGRGAQARNLKTNVPKILDLKSCSEQILSKNCRWVPGGEGYSHTLPIRVSAAQRGRDFEAPDLEWGIHFRGVF